MLNKLSIKAHLFISMLFSILVMTALLSFSAQLFAKPVDLAEVDMFESVQLNEDLDNHPDKLPVQFDAHAFHISALWVLSSAYSTWMNSPINKRFYQPHLHSYNPRAPPGISL